MIVLAIKSFLFSRTDSYSLRRKSYIFYFFLSFYKDLIKVVYAILVITIKDLEVRLGNLNLPPGKSAISFESLALKGETGKQTTNALYY